ncbi:hypothetical protein ACTA71_004658 [Dictyostelium dimigraforme]
MDQYDYLFNILVIGDTGVGKSSITERFTKNKFKEDFIPTIGIDFHSKIVFINGRKMKLHIWDTPGNNIYRVLNLKSQFRSTNAFIFVYDVTDQLSFDNISRWLDVAENKEVIKLIIGNKNDLITKKVVDPILAKEFAGSLDIKFLETSAKQSNSIEEAFISVTELCVKQKDENNKTSIIQIPSEPSKSNCILN